MKTNLKDWLKISFVVLLTILANTFPIILTIVYDNWWLMLLYFIVPILDGLLLIIFNAMIVIFKW